MPSIQVNDIQMYYEMRSEGEPLVVILGLANDISEASTGSRKNTGYWRSTIAVQVARINPIRPILSR
jgi:hypothetical protein